MNDEVLGTLLPDGSGALTGATTYRGRTLALCIDPSAEDLPAVIALAHALVGSLATFDEKARQAAALELLSSYNENWREFERAREDGTFVTVSNPQLSESEFIARIQLQSLEVTGKDIFCLWYNDDGLFAGHSIIVTSLDGEKFSDVHASLFG